MVYNASAAAHGRRLLDVLKQAEQAYVTGDHLLYTDRLRALATALMAGGDPLREHLHARVRQLRLTSTTSGPGRERASFPEAGGWQGPPPEAFGRRHPELPKAAVAIGAPIWSARNRVRSPDFGGAQHYWWSCPRGWHGHADWQQTLWQYERGRTCPSCWAESMGRTSWRPEEVRWGGHVKFAETQVLETDGAEHPRLPTRAEESHTAGHVAAPSDTRAEGVSRLMDVYCTVTGVRPSPKLQTNLEQVPELSRLMYTDDETLRVAAEWLGGGGGTGFPVASWAWAATHVHCTDPASTICELESRIPTARRDQRVLLHHVGHYVDESMSRLAKRYTAQVLQEARRRIIDRAATAEFACGAYARRRPKCGHRGSRPLRSVPIIDADDTELAVMHLLALTGPDAQFSYTPAWSGRVFAGWKDGYHRGDEERVYVTGLSDVLDSATSIVQNHRNDGGGRVFVRHRRVVCADCQEVVAWAGSAEDDRWKAPSHGHVGH